MLREDSPTDTSFKTFTSRVLWIKLYSKGSTLEKTSVFREETPKGKVYFPFPFPRILRFPLPWLLLIKNKKNTKNKDVDFMHFKLDQCYDIIIKLH